MKDFPTPWRVEDRGMSHSCAYGPGSCRYVIVREELLPTRVISAEAQSKAQAETIATLMNGVR